ncbi:hypothetical protein FOFC_06019 [Fusarium oxysporum]|nr:hypothetical protein FOFC_06019 [Fusarium oxysporum]
MTGSGAVTLLISLFVEHEKERHNIAWTHYNGPKHLDVVRYGFIGLVPKVATCFAKTLKQSVKHHSRSRYHTRPSRVSHIRHRVPSASYCSMQSTS